MIKVRVVPLYKEATHAYVFVVAKDINPLQIFCCQCLINPITYIVLKIVDILKNINIYRLHRIC